MIQEHYWILWVDYVNNPQHWAESKPVRVELDYFIGSLLVTQYKLALVNKWVR